MKKCCFSGHRTLPEKELPNLKIDLDVTLRGLIAEGVCEFFCGGARGFDLLAAENVLYLKKTYPFLKLHLILPCKEQEEFWSKEDKEQYYSVLALANSVEFLYEKYNNHCMFERNRALTDSADILLCYLTNDSGGTAYTVKLAAKKKMRIIPVGIGKDEKILFEENFLSGQTELENI